jgi:DNA-binding beta-propeller fold protein YncE
VNLFADACTQDHTARIQPGTAHVIWHDNDLALTKTISLDGRRLTVTYDNAPAGHQVSNECSVDLRSAMTGRGFHERAVDPEAGTVTVTGGARGRVTITPGRHCHLSPASLIPNPSEAEKQDLSVDFLRLHRVLTDTVVVECPDGGRFDYTIDIGN